MSHDHSADRPGGSLPVRVFEDSQAIGVHLARQLLDGLAAARQMGRPYLVGCPGGRSLMSTYRAWATEALVRQADLSRVILVMMDEYVEPVDNGFAYCPDTAHYSCRRFAREQIAGLINRDLPRPSQIPASQVWFPDPAAPEKYDERIREAGGVDLFLAASGASDGHVAFNPPGSELAGRSRIVQLADSTRRDNMNTFPEFKSLDEVPLYGVTVGLGTLATLSARVAMVIHGANKRQAVERLTVCDGFDPTWPASFVYACPVAQVLVDRAAWGGAV